MPRPLKTASAVDTLQRKRANALRRAEFADRALERLQGTKEAGNIRNRRRFYYEHVARLTLQIEALRSVQGKDVRVLGH
jgi:hypothetical protein